MGPSTGLPSELAVRLVALVQAIEHMIHRGHTTSETLMEYDGWQLASLFSVMWDRLFA